MAIKIGIDLLLAQRRESVGGFAAVVGIAPGNVAVLTNGRTKAVRFSTVLITNHLGLGSQGKSCCS